MLPIDKTYLKTNLINWKTAILDPAYIIQKETLPTASAQNLGKVFQYIGSNTDYTIGGFYQCQVVSGSDPVEYTWAEITSKTSIDNTTIKENSSKQIYVPKATDTTLGVVQAGDGIGVDSDGVISVVARLEEIAELPTAAAALEGKIYLLTATQTGYDRGGIYMCEESTETAGTYEWVLISSSPLEAGKGITIENNVISADTNVFTGTLDEWDALTPAEQAEYDFIATPDEAVEDIADAIIDGDMRAITSNAVAQVVPSDASSSNQLVTENDMHGLLNADNGITTDLNSAIKTGTYIVTSSSANIPSGYSYGALVVYGQKTDTPSSTNQWIFQEFHSTGDAAVFIRKSTNSSSLTPTNWTSWQKLITESDLSYFTFETKTGGTWINGKPIYRKVIDLGALPNATTKVVSHGISNLDVIINWYGYAERSSDGGHFPLPYVFGGLAENNIGIFASQSIVTITTGLDRSGMNGTLILEYTKTTD